ncbi:SLC13 family permease [Sorangium sp. So ce296]|uniref:SLC13 family permease n=1 Tax=Sorangium sp. So ce296 TaxID=3133296 RepID=UPI003F5E0274
MTPEAIVALVILGLAIALFVSDRMRLDVVAMTSLLALTISGVATVPEALAGFSNPAVLMIAGLFVVGAALTDTGVADWLGQRLEPPPATSCACSAATRRSRRSPTASGSRRSRRAPCSRCRPRSPSPRWCCRGAPA